MKNRFINFTAVALAASFATSSAWAATITLDVQNVVTAPDTPTVFGVLQYEGTLGDILGFYNATTSNALAERFDAGNNGDEEDLVETLTGLTMVSLGGTELPITGTSASVAANTYFTAKFGGSVAVFHNTTDSAITVSFDASSNDACKEIGLSPSLCGGISHYKVVSDGTTSDDDDDDTPPVPLPAAGWMLIAGVGGLYAMRRRRKS